MSDLESRVKFNHDFAEEATKRRGYTYGQHFCVVTAAEKQMSKGTMNAETNFAKWKMLVLTLKPVTDPNDITSVVGRGLRRYVCLPFWDEAWDSFEDKFQNKIRRNMGIFTNGTHEALRALLPNEVPGKPVEGEGGVYVYNDSEIEASAYRDSAKEAVTVAADVAERLWNEGPSELVEQGCYVLVGADPKGKTDFDQILRMSPTQIVDRDTGEVMALVDASNIEGGGDEEEDTDKGEAIAAKSNGAKGKPSASADTVAAARANKKGSAKRASARR